jgi:hypothetical protein
MQDVDRITHVQALAKPPRHRRVRVQLEPRRLMPGAQDARRILGDLDRWRHLGQRPTIRPSELQLAVRLTLELEALFVDRAVVPTADECEVGQRVGPPWAQCRM